ncbi:helix-turn-helix domain-containing protein [Massilia pseudoviolaceinigra]|uniref:helix-turn-helix domain-containing protein n=1 Tax=Massilia pseudoviolaceinigra TaxID=3057165 RepID=UPI00279650E0|nr:helix-turn-helix domain-containing protein [Massilia sp. CCM 9206]MDQ1919690.1 hypothetical protein [Massilia sp. CCM 9206]
MFHFTDGGLRNVWLKNGYVEKETPYGKTVSYHDLDGLIRTICLALAHKPGKLTGAEFRYLRSALLLSQKSLGKLLGCTEQSIAKWEKQGRIPKAEDFLIRLIYLQQHTVNDKAATAVDTLNAIDRVSNIRIIVSETDHNWTWELAAEGNEQLLEPA